MYGGVKVQLHSFLTSVRDAGKWSTSRPERFTLGERAPRYPLDRRLEVPHNSSVVQRSHYTELSSVLTVCKQ